MNESTGSPLIAVKQAIRDVREILKEIKEMARLGHNTTNLLETGDENDSTTNEPENGA